MVYSICYCWAQKGIDHKVLVAFQSLVDYIFIAHYPLASVTDLETNLRIPKLHALLHYIENLYQLSVPDNFSTKTPESLHIQMCKDPYKASNHCNFDCQILNYLDIQDHLTLCLLYYMHKEKVWRHFVLLEL